VFETRNANTPLQVIAGSAGFLQPALAVGRLVCSVRENTCRTFFILKKHDFLHFSEKVSKSLGHQSVRMSSYT